MRRGPELSAPELGSLESVEVEWNPSVEMADAVAMHSEVSSDGDAVQSEVHQPKRSPSQGAAEALGRAQNLRYELTNRQYLKGGTLPDSDGRLQKPCPTLYATAGIEDCVFRTTVTL